MKKLFITILATLTLSSFAYAGSVNVGLSGSIIDVSASGTETTTAGDVAGGQLTLTANQLTLYQV